MTPAIVDAAWGMIAALALVNLACFAAARRSVSLRAKRWCLTAVVCLALRLVLAGFEAAWNSNWDRIMTLACGSLLLLLLPWRRYWLVRATGAQLQEQIEHATRGLFLACQQDQPGHYALSAKDHCDRLIVRSIASRVQGMRLPACRAGKIGLLRQWFAKQYPGPLPRLTITLSRRDS